MLAELVILEHSADPDQWIPLVVGASGLLSVTWAGIAPSVAALRTLQFLMLVYIGSAVIGVTLHVQADAEAPALAPGLLAQLGCLGLLATYRHPTLRE